MAEPRRAARTQQRVTQKDVAERAGVAAAVVSYVLNDSPRPVSAEARARVLAAMSELGYRPNEHARRLMLDHWSESATPRQFGIIIGESHEMLNRPFYTALIVGLLNEAMRLKYTLRFLHLYDSLQNPILFNEQIHPEEVAGVIVMHYQVAIERHREMLDRVIEQVGNVVCLDFQYPGLSSILLDQREAGRIATQHLIGLGHCRIAYVGNQDNRFEGYLDRLRQNDIPFDPALAVADRSANSPADGVAAVADLLALPEPPTAVFCVADEVALGVLSESHRRGMRVPNDLSVIGVDDIGFAKYTIPQLTTVAVSKQGMASLAMRTLVDRVEHPDTDPVNMVFPVRLVERESTAAPR